MLFYKIYVTSKYLIVNFINLIKIIQLKYMYALVKNCRIEGEF